MSFKEKLMPRSVVTPRQAQPIFTAAPAAPKNFVYEPEKQTTVKTEGVTRGETQQSFQGIEKAIEPEKVRPAVEPGKPITKHMGLFAAIGVGAKIVKGLVKGARSKRKAKKAKKTAAKAARLEQQSKGIIASAGIPGFGAMAEKMFQGTPTINNAPLQAVQETVFGGTPDMNVQDSDPTTSFASIGSGGPVELAWYQKIPVWAWVVGGVLIVPLFIFLIVKMFKR